MSDDLINKKEALNLLRKRSQQLVGIYGDLGGAVSGVARLIDEFPSADRPQGEWLIEKTCYDNYNYRCSYCDWYETHAYPDVEPYNFCPNCGSKMRGEHDD